MVKPVLAVFWQCWFNYKHSYSYIYFPGVMGYLPSGSWITYRCQQSAYLQDHATLNYEIRLTVKSHKWRDERLPRISLIGRLCSPCAL